MQQSALDSKHHSKDDDGLDPFLPYSKPSDKCLYSVSAISMVKTPRNPLV